MKIAKILGSALLISLLVLPISLASQNSKISTTSSILPCYKTCRVDSRGYTLIRNFEGYSPFIYKDSIGIPTIGFGHAVKPGETIEQPLMGDNAQQLLEQDVASTEKSVNKLLKVPQLPTQFDALASFTYNLGSGTLQKSTLLKKVNSNNFASVPPQFLRYVYAGKEPLAGLVNRRKQEANLYAEE
jgi:lysozyme